MKGIDLTKQPQGTTLATLRKNGWWDHGVQNIVRIKKQIENAESNGMKKINVPTIINSHAIAYFESFGFKTRTYQTMEGSQTDIEWE